MARQISLMIVGAGDRGQLYADLAAGDPRVRIAADPFLGLGSSAVACAALGVSFIGIELDEHYLKEAVARAARALRPTQA